MAELGVFEANLSLELLQQLPSLQMLLVDPYHLRLRGRAEDQPQGRSEAALQLAAEKLQHLRPRATHLLQGSIEAAQWVERSMYGEGGKGPKVWEGDTQVDFCEFHRLPTFHLRFFSWKDLYPAKSKSVRIKMPRSNV